MTEQQLINVTLEYGQGYDEVEEKDTTKRTKIYDVTSEVKDKILDYHLHKIVYTLNANQTIQSLKFLYKDRFNGSIKALLDTTEGQKGNEKEEEIEFTDLEEIIQVFFYVSKEERLVSICIETNHGKTKYIGDYSKGELIRDYDLDTKNNVVIGFGVNANKNYGVTSMFCYILDKNKYGIFQYSGLLQLRAKLKTNKDFRANLETKKDSLNESQKLLLNTCDLPDAAFFPIVSYIMTQ